MRSHFIYDIEVHHNIRETWLQILTLNFENSAFISGSAHYVRKVNDAFRLKIWILRCLSTRIC